MNLGQRESIPILHLYEICSPASYWVQADWTAMALVEELVKNGILVQTPDLPLEVSTRSL